MSDTEMAVLLSCATGAISTPELLGALGYGSRTSPILPGFGEFPQRLETHSGAWQFAAGATN